MSHSHRPPRFTRPSLILVLLALMVWFALAVQSANNPPFVTANIATRRNLDLARFFREQEIIKLDAPAVARRVRESGQLSIVTHNGALHIELTPHDMRAPEYHAEEVGLDGKARPINPAPIRTYKGTVNGRDAAQARFTISDETIAGVILTESEQYYVEPARKYTPAALANEFVFYKASDSLADSETSCDMTTHDRVSRLSDKAAAGATLSSSSESLPLGRVVEIATEADFEYVNKFGGSTQANNEILSVLNVVEGVYEKELGITFSVTFQHTWATSDDPYTSTDRSGRLSQFINHWNSNFQNVNRDLAHMWTDVDGGIATLGTVCNVTAAYGTSDAGGPRVTTHEIGHNLGANHPDQLTIPVDDCAGTIMRSIQARDLTFCYYSRNEITAYVNTRGSCLSPSTNGCATLALSSTDSPMKAGGGTGFFRVEASSDCFWSAQSNADWVTITSGGTGTGRGVVRYSVTPNGGSVARAAKITVGGRAFFISQDAAACASVPSPITWWKGEGDAVDSIGLSQGKLFGNPGFTSGLVGEAFRFNWVNIFGDYFYAPTTGLPKSNNDMTVEFWFKFENSSTNEELRIRFESYIGGATRARYEINLSGSFKSLNFRGEEPLGTTLSAGWQSEGWHHAAVTNQGNNVTIYIDGDAKANGIVLIDIPSSTAFYMGNVSKALVDEFGVYNRALSPADIKAIFMAGGAGKCGASLSTNPVDDTTFYVTRHYRDFLSRSPDPAGLAFWTNEIKSCGSNPQCIEVKRINVSAAFYLSIEFQQTGYLVYRMNKASYGTMPKFHRFLTDTLTIGRGVVVGATGWEQQLEFNKQSFADAWVNRSEFKSLFDGKSNGQYVDALIANTGVAFSQADRDALVTRLNSGAETRATVLRKIAENEDFARKEFNSAFVLMQYFGYLRRNPDDAPDTDFGGFNFWLTKLNEFNGNFVQAEMVKAFITSIEFRKRFGQP